MSIHILGVGSLGTLLASQIRSTQPDSAISLLVRSGAFARRWTGKPAKDRKKEAIKEGTDECHESGASTARLPDQITVQLDRGGSKDGERDVESIGPFDLEWISSAATPDRLRPKLKAQTIRRMGQNITLQTSARTISTLFVTTKAPSVIPALRLIQDRLAPTSTIIMLQDGMGVLDEVVDTFFPRAENRPSFIMGLSSHSCYRKFRSAIPQVSWRNPSAGSLPFTIIPSPTVIRQLSGLPESDASQNPLVNLQSTIAPTLAQHLPQMDATLSLHAAVTTLLRCSSINPIWLPLPTFQIQQFQRLVANSAVNPLSAVSDSLNGHLYGSQYFNQAARKLCAEASAVLYAAQYPSRKGAKDVYEDLHPLSAAKLFGITLDYLRRNPQAQSSTLSDIKNRSERTEIDYMNGYISRLGKHLNIPTPTHDLMVELVNMRLEQVRIGVPDSRRHY